MATAYDSAFFSAVSDVSLPSARAVVPLVVELIHPRSVVDIGCGPGAWLRVFAENGVTTISGIDGDYIDQSKLLIEPIHFSTADLTKDFYIETKYDLAVCIEVAEHLPSECADTLIERLTSVAPVVLFSSAIPGQGGTNHVNEQWPEYWCDLFVKRDFVAFDPFRPLIRNDLRVAFWVRQNLLLFVNKAALSSYPNLARLSENVDRALCEWVHMYVYEKWFREATRTRGVKELLRDLRSAIERSIWRRLG